MVKKISAITIGEYLEYVTILWFSHGQNLPPNDPVEYLPYIRMMAEQAAAYGDLEHLKLAFEYLLNNPGIDCEQFDGGNYPFDSDEIRAIIRLAYQSIWGTISLPPKRNDVEIVGAYLSEWRLHSEVAYPAG